MFIYPHSTYILNSYRVLGETLNNELTGERLRNVEALKWIDNLKNRLNRILTLLEDLGDIIFRLGMYKFYMKPLKFRCNDVEHSVIMGETFEEYAVNRVLHAVMCRHLNSFVVPVAIYRTDLRRTPKKYFISILKGKEGVREVGITCTDYGGFEIRFEDMEIALWLPWYEEGCTEFVGRFKPAEGMTWGEFAEQINREYVNSFSHLAILKNVSEFILGLAEMLEKYVDGLEDIANNYKKYISMIVIYP